MPKRHTSLLSLYATQKARFDAVNGDALVGMQILRRDALAEMDELVRGVGPQGSARIKALRAAGHPYARNASRFDTANQRFGSKRGVSKTTPTGRAKKHGFVDAGFPMLPIGVISGNLRKAKFASTDKLSLTIGFNQSAGSSIYSVLPFGTNNMVARGLWGPNEGGELGKRMKRFRLAFRKSFFDPLGKP